MRRKLTVIAVSLLFCARVHPGGREDGWFPVSRELVDDSTQVLKDEESRSTISAWIWGVCGTTLATYAIVAFSGGRGSTSGLKYFAALGAIGALGSAGNDIVRRREMNRLRTLIVQDVGATEPNPAVSPATVQAVGGEFRKMHGALIKAAAGSIRAGCVVPVLLSGMAVFGFAMGNPAGADLAGISASAALGIGAPSMLYYLNIKRDLDRMDALMKDWNQTFRDIKKEGVTQ